MALAGEGLASKKEVEEVVAKRQRREVERKEKGRVAAGSVCRLWGPGHAAGLGRATSIFR